MSNREEINKFIDKLKERGEPCIFAMFTAGDDFFRVNIPDSDHYSLDISMMILACDKMKDILEEELAKGKE